MCMCCVLSLPLYVYIMYIDIQDIHRGLKGGKQKGKIEKKSLRYVFGWLVALYKATNL